VVRVFPDFPDDSRDVASIAEFTVLPAYRRRGVGRAAIEALLVAHRERGAFEVEAGILDGNAPAKAFWAALGFDVRSIVTARRP
jgi:GNAT superfamily N-acetyltransferase